MEPNDRRRSALRQRLALAGAVLGFAVIAMGCHVHPWDKHVGTVHSIYDSEEFCTDVNADGLTQQQFASWVEEALFASDGWDAVNGVFPVNRGLCDDLEASLDNIEIHFRVTDAPFCGQPGCAQDPLTCSAHDQSSYSHKNCPFFEVAMATFWINSTADARNSIINHETGHGLGLADPQCDETGSDRNCDDPTDAADRCWVPLPVKIPIIQRVVRLDHPILSIMHTSGWCCPDLEAHEMNQTTCKDHWHNDLPFPSHYDRTVGQLIADNHEWVR